MFTDHPYTLWETRAVTDGTNLRFSGKSKSILEPEASKYWNNPVELLNHSNFTTNTTSILIYLILKTFISPKLRVLVKWVIFKIFLGSYTTCSTTQTSNMKFRSNLLTSAFKLIYLLWFNFVLIRIIEFIWSYFFAVIVSLIKIIAWVENTIVCFTFIFVWGN